MIARRVAFDVGRRTVGARVAGTGPGVAVIGPLDRSALAIGALVEELSRTHAVVALDPPGYGGSEPLYPGWSIAAAAAWSTAALEAVGLGGAPVVGIGSGGLVALELAGSHPVVLDDIPLLDAPARARLAASWAPPNPVRADGTHVLAHWARRRAELLWFPWFDQRPSAALDVDVRDVADLHAAVLDAVHAGDRWGEPYAAIWGYDATARLNEVDAVVLMPSTPLFGIAPDAVSAGPDPAARRAVVASHIGAHAGSPVVPRERDRDRWVRAYPDLPCGQMAAWSRRPAVELHRPLGLLHASPLSGRSLRPLADGLAQNRWVVLLDTLGNGDSDVPDPRPGGADLVDAADLAAAALAALTDLGVEDVDIYGTHTGAVVGLEMALAAPGRVARLVVNGLPLFDAADRASAERYLVDLTPVADGTHLLRAWSNVVDVLTWFPWYARDPAHRRALPMPDAATLHDRFDQFAASGTGYVLSHGAVFRHPTRARLEGLDVPTLFCRAPADPLAAYVDEAAAAVAGDVVEIGPAGEAHAVRGWLDAGLAGRRRVAS
jgi:pimeloyl-ACP methyl ester carboxylesterase